MNETPTMNGFVLYKPTSINKNSKQWKRYVVRVSNLHPLMPIWDKTPSILLLSIFVLPHIDTS